MRALVTGGAGYIGSSISNYLLDKGHEVIIVDNLSTGTIHNVPKEAKFYKFDIVNSKKITKIFLEKKIDIVFHFAAFINNEESLKRPKKYYDNNYKKGKIFFENCIKNNVKKFIYSSTAAVYGNKNFKINEKERLNPISPYSKSKLKLENFLIKNKKKISCIILRYFNVAGVDKKLRCGFYTKKGSNLILNLCFALKKKNIFTVNGNDYETRDGTPIRDYIHVQDLAEIHLLAAKKILKKNFFKIFNCGYGHGYSVMEILKKFNFYSNSKIRYVIGKRRKNDIVISIADPKKIIQFLKWRPKHQNLEHVVKSSLKWYLKHI